MERKVEWRTKPASGTGGTGGGCQEMRNGTQRTVWLRASRSPGGSFSFVALILGHIRPRDTKCIPCNEKRDNGYSNY